MINLNDATIAKMHAMTASYGDRILKGEPTELELWHIDRSTFAAPQRVTIIQTYLQDYQSGFYRCETPDRRFIDSMDLMDHEPTLTADEAGARYWM